jgi:peptidoglycan/xylan/chitin deacetylase (PgdA/CDA1 family)
MKYIFLFLVLNLSLAKADQISQTAQAERPPQFVLISFDGSYSDQFWKETFHLADQTQAKFSYFVSGVYFVEGKDRANYQGPGHAAGRSDIGFGKSDLHDIQSRTENVWQAIERNFDVGSHANGHFDGSQWNEKDWFSEFTQFHKFLEKIFSIYPALNEKYAKDWESILHQKIKGFRAPLLAENESSQIVLKQFNYLYDSSKILNHQWPYQMSDGIWNIGLSEVDLFATNRHTIAMDYNILYGQCEGKFSPTNKGECADLTDAKLADFEEQTYQSYIAAFLRSYYSNRAPLSIGHHFSLFNRGIYWQALQKFVYAVCTQPEVQCVTHSEMVAWLENQRSVYGANDLATLNKGQFNKLNIPAAVAQALRPNLPIGPPIASNQLSFESNLSVEVDRFEEDPIETEMLKGDMAEAHRYDREQMDVKALRYHP